MRSNFLLSACVTGALALSASAFAHGGGGGGGGMSGGGMGGGAGGMGGMGPRSSPSAGPPANPRGDEPETTPEGPSTLRDDSQGPQHVSTNGGAHANSHSVVAGAGAPTGPLAGLKAGMTLTDAHGQVVGTISRVIRSSGGEVRNVLVTPASAAGLHRHTLPVRPSSISLSGTTAKTSLTLSSIRG